MIRITYAFLSFTILSFLVSCTAEVPAKNTDDAKDSKGAQVVNIENRVVDASCGQCQLGLPGTGCDDRCGRHRRLHVELFVAGILLGFNIQ